MTSKLVRLGQCLETRAAPAGSIRPLPMRSLHRGIKRKRRNDWTCSACLATKRGYSGDARTLGGAPWESLLRSEGDQDTTDRVLADNNAYEQSMKTSASVGRSQWDWRGGTQDGGFGARNGRPPGHFHLNLQPDQQGSTSRPDDAPPIEGFGELSPETAVLESRVLDYAPEAPSSSVVSRPVSARYVDSASLDIDYTAKFQDGVVEENADLVLRCLYSAWRADDIAFIRSIPEETFTSILNIIHPRNKVAQLLSVLHDLTDDRAHRMGIASGEEVAGEYSDVLLDVYAMRCNAGVALALEDYKILLQSAKILGDGALAQSVWQDLGAAGYEPDIDCYNEFLGSVVSRDRYVSDFRTLLGAVPTDVELKKRFDARLPILQHARDVATSLLGEMLGNGIVPNEASFCGVMITAARVGELDVAKAMMKRVWNIDVDNVLAGHDAEGGTLAHAARGDALRPTSELLFTVAHSWGINDDIPSALRLVDYIARSYKVKISEAVWRELFDQTFLLTATRRKRSSPGRLPLQALTAFWRTMTEAPYSIEPSMPMYNRYIPNLCHGGDVQLLVEELHRGRLVRKVERFRRAELWEKLSQNVKTDEPRASMTAGMEAELARSRWDFELQALVNRRNMTWVQRWAKMVIGRLGTAMSGDFTPYFEVAEDYEEPDHASDTEEEDGGDGQPGRMLGEGAESGWPWLAKIPLTELPPLLWRWKWYMPSDVTFFVPGGRVTFTIKDEPFKDEGWKNIQRNTLMEDKVLANTPRLVGSEWMRHGKPTRRFVRMARLAEAEASMEQRAIDERRGSDEGARG